MPEPDAPPQITASPDTERLEQDAAPLPTEDEIEQIFRAVISEKPTQPLVRQKTREEQAAERCVVLCTLVLLLSFVAGSVVAVVTYPTVTITLTPRAKSVMFTAPLALATRPLAPVTLTQSAAISTTGTGHQAATRASGTLTFYNGQATPQSVPGGSLFTTRVGIQVITDQAVTVPGASPPSFGQASAPATAVTPGSSGNLPANAVNAAGALFVKNLTAFRGGQNARTYPAVAPQDIAHLTATLKARLVQQLPQAFRLQADEALFISRCLFNVIPDHKAGEEALRLIVTASQTCTAVAYNRDELVQQATTAFLKQTRPGAQYTLVGAVSTTLTSVSPMTVQVHGLWVYTLSQRDEQGFATHIAGDSPQQATAYLLQTDVFTHVTVPHTLPKDPQHIQFVVQIGS